MSESTPPAREVVRVRKVPKFSVFLVLGAGIGILAAAILTFAFQGTEGVSPSTGLVYTSGQVFGFLALICVVVGIALFGTLALILDRVFRRRAREFTAEHTSSHSVRSVTEGNSDDGPASRVDG